PAPADQRGHQQAALVEQDEVGALPPGLFLMRGQSLSNHAAMASGSRWRGTRLGLCGVKSRSRSHTVRYSGLRETPNSRWINWARYGPVQRSVRNPCSVAFSAKNRRRIFSWVWLNLGGRPEGGWARSPALPFCRKAATHRRTERGSTSRNSATSWVVYPSRTRWTARRRRYSSSAAVPLSLITESV